MTFLRFHMTYKSIQRLRQIVSVFIKHGFYPLMERIHLHRLISLPQRLFGKKAGEKEAVSFAVRLRLAFEELGPTFIKLGQILSTRPDMLPEEFVKEFLKLQDEVPPFSFDEAANIIEQEFGAKIEILFKTIEKEPVAAASIAQVHRAKTIEGDDVVVKVQRPNIQDTITTDIVILQYIARQIVKYIPDSNVYDPVGMVDEFSKAIVKEMDFTLEASYTEKFKKNFSGDDRIVIPKVYWELTGKRVLTLERIEGVKVDNIEKLASMGIDTEKTALLIVRTFFKQVFEHGIFHGDLHSGNIFVLEQDKVAFVDFGIVGKVSRDMMDNLAAIFISLMDGNCDKLIAIYTRMGIIGEDVDKEGFRNEYEDMLLHYFGRPFKFTKLGELIREYIRIASKYNIRMPRDLFLLDKCILELEGLGRVLYPDIDILKEGQDFASDLIKKEVSLDRVAGDVIDTVNDYKELTRALPQQLNQIFKKMVGDKFTIDFMHKGLEDLIGEVDRSSNRITFGLMISALIIGSSLVMTFGVGPKIFGFPLFGIIGFAAATILSLWLGIMILRSGKF
ncbi:MAG: AarF/ABC1/UbiB kinase family protein [Deltaproteobacteria bacterium]|nr:AarF/ABC1/UbiB kinase family protein [Deltaproteobacteria bacterium]